MEEKDPNKQEDGFNKHILFAALITIITVVSFGVIPDLCNKYESKPVVVYSLSRGQTSDEGSTSKVPAISTFSSI